MKRDFNFTNIVSIEADRSPQGPVGRLLKPGSGWKRGLTLIELLVASLIMVVVTGAAFTLFRLTATTEKYQQEVMTQTQNLRAALYAVSRDIRMAGSGLPMIGAPVIHVYVNENLYDADTQDDGGEHGDWFRYKGETDYGVRAIFGSNSDNYANADDKFKSDSLSIFRAELESTAALGVLGAPFNPGSSTQVVLQDSVTEGQTFSSGDILAIADGFTAIIVQVEVASADTSYTTLPLGPRFKPEKPLPGSVGVSSFPAGSQVYNLRDVTFVTYYVDSANHRLMANYHDIGLVDSDADDLGKKHLVTVADSIEDFQVTYFFSVADSPDLTEDPDINIKRLRDDGDVVQGVQIAMVSRARNRSELSTKGSAVEIMGHKAKEEKGFTRRVLSEVVQLRNF